MDPVQQVVQNHGDLIFDFCESTLRSPANAQIIFRNTLKDIKKTASEYLGTQNERAWALKMTYQNIKNFSEKHHLQQSNEERLQTDTGMPTSARLKNFESYFQRLHTDDQILFLLKDKYGLTYSEIATTMGIPENSLKMRRQQALRTLEEWLWDKST